MKRRAILTSAAAGTAAVTLAAAGKTIAGDIMSAGRGAVDEFGSPVVAYISDAATREVTVMVGDQEIVRRDAALVARLVAIAKEAGDVVAS